MPRRAAKEMGRLRIFEQSFHSHFVIAGVVGRSAVNLIRLWGPCSDSTWIGWLCSTSADLKVKVLLEYLTTLHKSNRAEIVEPNVHIKRLTGLAQPVDGLTTTRGAVTVEEREAVAAGL